MTPAMISTAPTVATENRKLVSATVPGPDDTFLDVCATMYSHSAPSLHLKWYEGPWDGQTLNFSSLEQVDDLIAALEAVRDRVAIEKQPK